MPSASDSPGPTARGGRDAVLEAIRAGDVARVAGLLDREPALARGRDGEPSPALAACYHRRPAVLGLLLAWAGHYLTQLPRTERHTYGYRSSSILAALFNAIILLAAIGGIVWEAVRRFSDPQPVAAPTVMWVAGVGVIINTLTALSFLKGRKHDLNIRGAFLHMAADAGVSVGVVLAGWGILATESLWIDPAVSLAVALVILIGTWGLLRESLNLALQAVPEGIDPKDVRSFLAGLEGVEEVHDLHIWAMSTTETALTAHLVVPAGHPGDAFLHDLAHRLDHDFGIGHATIQVETAFGEECALGPDEVI